VRGVHRVEEWEQDVYFCPQCDDWLMEWPWHKRCRRCRWTSPDYVAPEKKWTPNPHLKAERWAVSGGRCFYCGEEVAYKQRGLDHLVPQCRGGGHEQENLIPACRACNSGKHRKTLEEYRTWLRAKRYFFNDHQLAWLHAAGVSLTNEDAPAVVFAFEREGWH
jgi:5-methylcytosine-specific restriction endonuclease McrA